MSDNVIIREPDDLIAEARISLGRPRGMNSFYIVFRGDPEEVVKLLEEAMELAKVKLPENSYEDRRRLL